MTEQHEISLQKLENLLWHIRVNGWSDSVRESLISTAFEFERTVKLARLAIRASTPDAPDVESLMAAVVALADAHHRNNANGPIANDLQYACEKHASVIKVCRARSGDEGKR